MTPETFTECVKRAIVAEASAWTGDSDPAHFCHLLALLEQSDRSTFDRALRDIVAFVHEYETLTEGQQAA